MYMTYNKNKNKNKNTLKKHISKRKMKSKSLSRKNKKTKKNNKKGGELPFENSLVNHTYPNINTKKTTPKMFLDKIKNLKNESIYFFFEGTGCTTNKIIFKDANYSKIKYGATICRGVKNSFASSLIQISTSVKTTISNYTSKCTSPPLKHSILLNNLKDIIIKLLENNKVFLYGHSYGGSLATRLTQIILKHTTLKEQKKNLFVRTFGAPFINDFDELKGQVLNITFKEDDISQHNKNCVDLNNNNSSYILLELDITENDFSIYKDSKDKFDNLNKKQQILYFWKTPLSFNIHKSYEGDFYNYIINNIDHYEKKDVSKIKSELQKVVKDKGLLGKNVDFITGSSLLRKKIVEKIV